VPVVLILALIAGLAGQIETGLRTKPDDVEGRLTLIGYYSWNGESVVERQRLRTHVMWFIENHPEHPATQEPSLRDLPDDREGNALILELWNRNLESRPDDLEVLKNAEKFFFSRDPALAERILYRLAAKEPANEMWPRELALLYRMFGVPDYAGDSAQRALESYRRVLEWTRGPVAREALAGEMAFSAFRVGDFIGAAELAKIHLSSADRSAIHRANTLLGRVALRSGDVENAKKYLISSSDPEALRHVSTSGPLMILAKELLEKKERATVLQYLENCLVLWPRGESILQLWISEVKNGRTPNFGNLGEE
jgi:hypothetical protein